MNKSGPRFVLVVTFCGLLILGFLVIFIGPYLVRNGGPTPQDFDLQKQAIAGFIGSLGFILGYYFGSTENKD